MKLTSGSLRSTFVFLTVSGISMADTNQYYIVKPRDTLSEVLYGLGLKPVYGEKGYLKKVLERNSVLQRRQGDLIKPGQRITLSDENIVEVSAESPPVMNRPQISESSDLEVLDNQEVLAKKENPDGKIFRQSELLVEVSQGTSSVQGIDDNNSKGKLNSSSYYGINLEWSPKISESFWLSIGSSFQSLHFNKSDSRVMKGKQQNLSGFFLGANYQASPKWKTELKLGRSDQIFYRALDTNTIKIDKNNLTQLQGLVKYDFYEFENFKYSFKTGLKVYLPFSNEYYTGKLGHGYLGSVILQQKFSSFDVLASATYSRDHLAVESVRFDRDDFQIGFGVRFYLGNTK